MKKIMLMLFVLAGIGAVKVSIAEPILSVEEWIHLDLKVRQLTLTGMRERLKMLERNADVSTIQLLAERNETEIQQVISGKNITTQQYYSFAGLNSLEIDAWYRGHPDLKLQEEQLRLDFERVAQQIQSQIQQ